jgi:hypothetical protein
MTADLVAFLRARLDEDAAAARDAFGEHNDDGPEWTEVSSGALSTGCELHSIGDSGISRHMARWDPARVLAEVDAKWRILAIYASWEVLARPGAGFPIQHEAEITLLALRETLRALALPYRDHPDCRPEWTPND